MSKVQIILEVVSNLTTLAESLKTYAEAMTEAEGFETIYTPEPEVKEGTCAHELCEYKVNKYLGIDAADPTPGLEFFDDEMSECTDSYAQYIAEQIQQYSDPVVMVEQRLDFSKYVPDGFGTGDCVIVADEVMTVVDYKHGKGVKVKVDVDNNTQMMLYALGALELFGVLYDVSEIRMVIY